MIRLAKDGLWAMGWRNSMVIGRVYIMKRLES